MLSMNTYVKNNGKMRDAFDIVWEGQKPGDDPDRSSYIVRPFAEAGATWWIESPWMPPQRTRRPSGTHKAGFVLYRLGSPGVISGRL
jgi:hypothetical protein